MNTLQQKISSYFGAIFVTSILFFLLIFIETVFTTEAEPPKTLGAIKLSNIQDAPQNQKEPEVFTATEVVEMPEIEQVSEVDLQMEMPDISPSMPEMQLEFAPQLAGTVPVAGVPSMAKVANVPSPSGGALTLGEVDEIPREIFAPEPRYPREGKSNKAVTVYVRIYLETDGSVIRAIPLRRSQATQHFHESAINSIMRWQFTPCKKDGKAVRCIADKPITFKK